MTLQLKYLFKRLRAARYYKHGSHDPTFRANKSSTGRSLTCLSTHIYKRKRLRSLTIYKTLPRVQDYSGGNKLLVEVQAVLLVRQVSHLLNINKANMSTKVLSKTYIRSYHTCICIKKVMWGFSYSKPALTQWLFCSTTTRNFFEMRQRTRVH